MDFKRNSRGLPTKVKDLLGCRIDLTKELDMEANARGIVKSSTLISGWGKRMEAGTHSPMKYVRFWKENHMFNFWIWWGFVHFPDGDVKRLLDITGQDFRKNFELIRGRALIIGPGSYSIRIKVWYLHFISIQYHPFNNQGPSDIFHNVHAIQDLSGLIWCIHNHIISTPSSGGTAKSLLMKVVKFP